MPVSFCQSASQKAKSLDMGLWLQRGNYYLSSSPEHISFSKRWFEAFKWVERMYNYAVQYANQNWSSWFSSISMWGMNPLKFCWKRVEIVLLAYEIVSVYLIESKESEAITCDVEVSSLYITLRQNTKTSVQKYLFGKCLRRFHFDFVEKLRRPETD